MGRVDQQTPQPRLVTWSAHSSSHVTSQQNGSVRHTQSSTSGYSQPGSSWASQQGPVPPPSSVAPSSIVSSSPPSSVVVSSSPPSSVPPPQTPQPRTSTIATQSSSHVVSQQNGSSSHTHAATSAYSQLGLACASQHGPVPPPSS